MENKRCTTCGEVKELSEFTKRKDSKDGFRGKCKSCVKRYHAKWYKENTEKVKANTAKWYKENPEKVKAINKKWKKENHEKVKANTAKWQKENPEKIRANTKRWRKENPEKFRATGIMYQLKKQIGENPPPELVEIKLLIYKTKKLCKTLKN